MKSHVKRVCFIASSKLGYDGNMLVLEENGIEIKDDRALSEYVLKKDSTLMLLRCGQSWKSARGILILSKMALDKLRTFGKC